MTKDTVISMLRQSGDYISGEEISRKIGISRAAVNSAIKSLRADGYEISSVTNRGYKLIGSTDKLNRGELLAVLPERRMRNVICLDSVGSTNDYLCALAQDGAVQGTVVIADEQTVGKGRRGRRFSSPKGKGIYLSVLLRPDSLPSETANITAWVAVAMAKAISNVCGASVGVKWVNDLVLNRRKICGILTEMSVESESSRIQYIVVGIGINANEEKSDFSEEIRDIAGSIYSETGEKVNRAVLAAEMIRCLDELIVDWPDKTDKYLSEYRKRCITIGKRVKIRSQLGDETGAAVDIDDKFGLIVDFDDGTRRTVSSGEVSVRGLYGYID